MVTLNELNFCCISYMSGSPTAFSILTFTLSKAAVLTITPPCLCFVEVIMIGVRLLTSHLYEGFEKMWQLLGTKSYSPACGTQCLVLPFVSCKELFFVSPRTKYSMSVSWDEMKVTENPVWRKRGISACSDVIIILCTGFSQQKTSVSIRTSYWPGNISVNWYLPSALSKKTWERGP